MSPTPLKPIEYIGSKPRRKDPAAGFGGLVILFLAIGTAAFFGLQFSHLVSAQENRPGAETADEAVALLAESGEFGDMLAAAALRRTLVDVTFDKGYYKIDYPMGDIPASKGGSADLIVRAYRECGVDLQQLVHEDMQQNFRLYPQIWGASGADQNIDHRRVPNLQRFLTRKGESLARSRDVSLYNFGDVVAWFPNTGVAHMGIVVPGPGSHAGEKWVVHNFGRGPVWEDALTDHEIIGHYRYGGGE